MKVAVHPVYGAPRPRFRCPPNALCLVPRFPGRLRGFGATVAPSGVFGGVYDPATYLGNVITQLNAQGGNTPASVAATLSAALANNYCTPQNPSAACHDPAAAAALISELSSTAVTGTAPAPSGSQFGFQTPSSMPSYAPAPLTTYRSIESTPTAQRNVGPTQTPNLSANYVPTSGGAAPAPTTTNPTGAAPAPAATSWLTDSMVGGIPNWVLLALAGGAMFFMGGKR